MIAVELARSLRDAGLRWTPVSGDRFVVVDRDMDADVFVLSEMTVEVHRPRSAGGDTVFGFNGTTEWALDSVDQTDAVWLPAEDQLRGRLGDRFRRLEPTADGFAVTLGASADVSAGADVVVVHGATAEDAYARALLAQLLGEVEDTGVPTA